MHLRVCVKFFFSLSLSLGTTLDPRSAIPLKPQRRESEARVEKSVHYTNARATLGRCAEVAPLPLLGATAPPLPSNTKPWSPPTSNGGRSCSRAPPPRARCALAFAFTVTFVFPLAAWLAWLAFTPFAEEAAPKRGAVTVDDRDGDAVDVVVPGEDPGCDANPGAGGPRR